MKKISFKYEYSKAPDRFQKLRDDNGYFIYEIIINSELTTSVKDRNRIISVLVGSSASSEGFSFEGNSRVYCTVAPNLLNTLVVDVTVIYI